jgi:ADP-L-glycero-D-manno-heptose 6-epimerase
MIVITGGKGFIGKNLLARLILEEGYKSDDIITLDTQKMSLDSIYGWLFEHANEIDVIFHMGAITDTIETNRNLFDEYNFNCSVFIWQLCVSHNIPLIYASSAATYGDGSQGFDDEMNIINLKPLNLYGWSKQEFDLHTTTNDLQPPFWCGLKFFNVYGHGEEHKGKMASVVLHSYNQIIKTGQMKLFKSHNPNYKDGEQLRDFVYIDDIIDVCIWMHKNKPVSGIYNVGTGKARTFNDLARGVFNGLEIAEDIIYIDTPLKIRDNYQYFTEATIKKLRDVGYNGKFHELEEGIKKYINTLIFLDTGIIKI